MREPSSNSSMSIPSGVDRTTPRATCSDAAVALDGDGDDTAGLDEKDYLLRVHHSLMPSVANECASCLRGQDTNGTLRHERDRFVSELKSTMECSFRSFKMSFLTSTVPSGRTSI